jgi:hypothetical protein
VEFDNFCDIVGIVTWRVGVEAGVSVVFSLGYLCNKSFQRFLQLVFL